MSYNPNTFVTTKQKKLEQNRNDQENSQQQSNELPCFSIEEQLDVFADLLIDLYLLDQQLSNDHED